MVDPEGGPDGKVKTWLDQARLDIVTSRSRIDHAGQEQSGTVPVIVYI
jgi:hypothetical protein